MILPNDAYYVRNLIINLTGNPMTGRVAQWIRHQTSNLGIAGSSPAVVEIFCCLDTLARQFFFRQSQVFEIVLLLIRSQKISCFPSPHHFGTTKSFEDLVVHALVHHHRQKCKGFDLFKIFILDVSTYLPKWSASN